MLYCIGTAVSFNLLRWSKKMDAKILSNHEQEHCLGLHQFMMKKLDWLYVVIVVALTISQRKHEKETHKIQSTRHERCESPQLELFLSSSLLNVLVHCPIYDASRRPRSIRSLTKEHLLTDQIPIVLCARMHYSFNGNTRRIICVPTWLVFGHRLVCEIFSRRENKILATM